MNTAQPGAEAVAVRDGRILAVGNVTEVAAAAGKGAETIDLEGRAMLPGFIDSHGHFSTTTMYQAFENVAVAPVGPVEDIADILQILTAKKASTFADEWILGRGYDEAYLAERRHPNRFDLDKVSTENPIVLIHVSQHFLTCNSNCLELAGIDASSKDPEGGMIQRVAGSMEPNGVMEEQAMYKLLPFMPIHNVEKFLGLVGRAQDYYASFGITTLQDGASMKSDLQLFDLAAAQQMIDAVALAAEKHGIKDRRTTMIHAQTVREDQLDRMRDLQIIPSYFVSHTYFWGDWHRDSVLGPQRAARISPVKTSLDRAMVYTLHNDAPIVPPDMLRLV